MAPCAPGVLQLAQHAPARAAELNGPWPQSIAPRISVGALGIPCKPCFEVELLGRGRLARVLRVSEASRAQQQRG